LNNLIGLIAASSDQGAISEDEMMAMMVILLTGGVASTAASITASLLHLARHPDCNERIRKDPSLARAHLEETLRVEPPVSLVLRFATSDITLGDGTIPKGMPVYVMNAAACHDPAVFPDPHRFDIDRKNSNAHLAFGYGIHTCIGNAIVRNVVPLVIQSVAERMPNLRVAESNDAIEWDLTSARVRHLKTLKLVA
jgi:cytochrome P450